MGDASAASLPTAAAPDAERTAMTVLGAVAVAHLLNDLLQSLVVASYPMLKASYALTFGQIGLISFTNLITASVLQPVVGLVTDRHPRPYSLCVGMGVTLIGLLVLAQAGDLPTLLLAAALIGVGSSIFHPEASRIARLASGGRHGFGQSFFQVGGNLGSSLGPLLAAIIVLPRGQAALSWFSLAALAAMLVLAWVARWYAAHQRRAAERPPRPPVATGISRARTIGALTVLAILVFSKYVYVSSLTTYYTFYLIERFALTTQAAQLQLFLFLLAVAAGTLLGGPIGDRIGRKRVIWVSILGVAPFTIALPHANLLGTEILAVFIGFVIASAFSAILVYAQELVPHRIGMISGLFFGFAFGVAGIGAAALGHLADHAGMGTVFLVCSFLPLIGLITALLPDTRRPG